MPATSFKKITAAILAILFALLLVIPRIFARTLEAKIIAGLKGTCASCSLEIEKIRVGLFPLKASLSGIRFSAGDPRATVVGATAGEIRAQVNLPLRGVENLVISHASVEDCSVTVTEGELSGDSSKKKREPKGGGHGFILRELALSRCEFTYVRVRHGKEAKLRVREIAATIGELGLHPSVRDQMAEAKVKAKLEDSGDVDLKIKALLFSEQPTVDVELAISQMKLAELNPYFQTDDGIRLGGELIRSQGIVSVRGQAATGRVSALYRDLSLQFVSNPDRSGLDAFFSNLVKTLKLDSSSVDDDQKDRVRVAKLEREKNESLVSFILRGLKEAALSVATD